MTKNESSWGEWVVLGEMVFDEIASDSYWLFFQAGFFGGVVYPCLGEVL